MRRKRLSKEQWKRRKKIRQFIRITFRTAVTLLLFIVVIYFTNEWIFKKQNIMNQYEESDFVLNNVKLENGEKIKADLLSKNPYSRPGTKLKQINGIVIHYVGNKGTTAANNRNYFQSLSTKHTTYASSHFLVGLEGEIIQCVPLNEVAYCSNDRNDDTISIEVCHPKENGKFNQSTYDSVIALTAYLCDMFQISEDDVIRHYDVTGKRCPLYYVEHEDAWLKLKEDVGDVLTDIAKKREDEKIEDVVKATK